MPHKQPSQTPAGFIPNILTIAGSDSSGGAGIQADIKAISANGGYALTAITALTAQNTHGVHSSIDVPERFIEDQIRAVFDDIEIHAVKIGMLSHPGIIETVAETMKRYKPPHIVLDPVMVATSGDTLLSTDALDTLKKELIPLATLITPNIPEAEKLTRTAIIDTHKATEKLLDLNVNAALLKGGHEKGEHSTDILAIKTNNNIETHSFEEKRIYTPNTHGTGCTLSAAIATYLGHSYDLIDAVQSAKTYISGAIKHSDTLNVGKGAGPTHHFWHQKI